MLAETDAPAQPPPLEQLLEFGTVFCESCAEPGGVVSEQGGAPAEGASPSANVCGCCGEEQEGAFGKLAAVWKPQNSPANLPLVIRQLAGAMGRSEADVVRLTADNWRRMLGSCAGGTSEGVGVGVAGIGSSKEAVVG